MEETTECFTIAVPLSLTFTPAPQFMHFQHNAIASIM